MAGLGWEIVALTIPWECEVVVVPLVPRNITGMYLINLASQGRLFIVAQVLAYGSYHNEGDRDCPPRHWVREAHCLEIHVILIRSPAVWR